MHYPKQLVANITVRNFNLLFLGLVQSLESEHVFFYKYAVKRVHILFNLLFGLGLAHKFVQSVENLDAAAYLLAIFINLNKQVYQ